MHYRNFILPSMLAVSLATPAFAAAPSSEMDKVSYSLGAKTGESLKQQEIQVNTQQFSNGLNDALAGKKLSLTEQEIHNTLMQFQAQHIAKLTERDKKLASENAVKSEKFLKDNKTKPNVKTLPSGLQYVVLTPGKGNSPKSSDVVTVNYRGTLIDGTEFDSSYSRGEPTTFPLNELIPGWQEALLKMQPGAKWKIFVPPNLAYGEKGAGNTIQPNSALVFEIELINVKSEPSKKQ
jgi:FKBP-type peptidyl-prolyl cis-trans isomerase FklB